MMIHHLDKDSEKRFNESRVEIAAKYPGIEMDINKRWISEEFDHHPRSKAIMKKIKELDFYFNDDFFCWKSGGDGDNGESLMYLLDIIFESEDKNKSGKLLKEVMSIAMEALGQIGYETYPSDHPNAIKARRAADKIEEIQKRENILSG